MAGMSLFSVAMFVLSLLSEQQIETLHDPEPANTIERVFDRPQGQAPLAVMAECLSFEIQGVRVDFEVFAVEEIDEILIAVGSLLHVCFSLLVVGGGAPRRPCPPVAGTGPPPIHRLH